MKLISREKSDLCKQIPMFPKLAILLPLVVSFVASEDTSFLFNGFRSRNISLDGIAEITPNGILRLTNYTKQQKDLAFYPNPVSFKKSSTGIASSFSTTFVFAIISEYPTLSGHGIAFVVAPTRGLPGALPSPYLGLFNGSNNGNDTNHVFAVELDTIQNSEFKDINDNHVGIDINGLTSVESAPAGYYADDNGVFKNLTLISGHQMRVWVEYDGVEKKIEVTMAPINAVKPKTPLLSLSYDLSPIIKDNMYVGFSSSTGSFLTAHYVLGWSFKVNGQAPELDLSQLPNLPRIGRKPISKFFDNWVACDYCQFSLRSNFSCSLCHKNEKEVCRIARRLGASIWASQIQIQRSLYCHKRI
jgi:hypothetical protein